VRIRAKADIEVADNGREAIIVTEIPYQVNKARLIEKIAELVKEKKIEGISELRDESDKDGMRIVIEIKRGEWPRSCSTTCTSRRRWNRCSASTWWRWSMAAAHAEPQADAGAFVRHRREVVTRRTVFELRKARARAHILEGLTVALANIDEMIELIKTSPTRTKPASACWRGAGSRAWSARCWRRPAPKRRVRKTCPRAWA
jgi:DNA gyrase subunit A